MATINLTKGGFLRRVYDFESNPDTWIFRGERPAVIDFFATWCGPCKALSPVLEEVSALYEGKVDFYKVDVDSEEELASLFGVRSVPTLLFIPKEGEIKMTQGALPRNVLAQQVEQLLNK